MKPQIIILVSLMILAFILCSNTVNAAGKGYKRSKTEEASFNMKSIKAVADFTVNKTKNTRPSKPQHKENEKDGIPMNEAGHKKAHSEEDGKHHHFHMHRAKKAKHCAGLVCILAKILLVITHICLLVYTYYSALAHVAH